MRVRERESEGGIERIGKRERGEGEREERAERRER